MLIRYLRVGESQRRVAMHAASLIRTRRHPCSKLDKLFVRVQNVGKGRAFAWVPGHWSHKCPTRRPGRVVKRAKCRRAAARAHGVRRQPRISTA
jgi:hypothetical protein